MAVQTLNSLAQLQNLTSDAQPAVLYFWAEWCQPCKHMDTVFATLAAQHSGARFLKVEAEAVDEVTEKFDVSTVPYFVLLKGAQVADRVEGADAAALSTKVAALTSTSKAAPAAAPAATQQQPDLQQRIKALLDSHPVMLFMKGSPEAPRCGFSRKVAEALQAAGVSYKHFDILSDEEVRQGLKEYSNWPTYPQVYVKAELLGGCDIIMEMQAAGELKQAVEEQLGGEGEQAVPLQQRLAQLVKQEPVMLFMKGSPEAPRCGFSRKVAEALQAAGVQYGSFDILSDEEVRQGLKEYSNWPTYPQVYVQGELLGGCDIVLEMQQSGELKGAVEEMLHRMSDA